MTALKSLEQVDFAGSLQLVDQASEIDSAKALDGANWRIGAKGEIRTRGGTLELSQFDEDGDYTSLIYTEATGNQRLIGSGGAKVRALGIDGSNVANAAVTAGRAALARFGAPNAERVYGVNGSDFFYWNGTAFTVNGNVTVDGGSAAPPKGYCCAVTPWDNRLAVFGFSAANKGPAAANGSPSTVFFSEQGDPETWKAIWRETLYPGDGERFRACVAWRDRLFAFKDSRFFVFYGTSDNGFGDPIFDFYAVDARAGALAPAGVCAHRSGVYFIDRKGVFLTTGNEPVPVSGPIDALFRGVLPPFYTGEVLDRDRLDEASICAVGELLHVHLPTPGDTFQTFVFDPRNGWWGYDTMAATVGAAVPISGVEELVYGQAGTSRLYRHGELLGTENGDPIESHWQGAWQRFGAYAEKDLRRVRVWGVGDFAVSAAPDLLSPVLLGNVSLGTGPDLWGDGAGPDTWGDGMGVDTWGSGQFYDDGWVSRAVRGSVHSLKFQSVNGSRFSVQRVEHHVGAPRRASTDRQS